MLNAIYKFLVIYSLFDFIFCIKIRQCDYCLNSFVYSFIVAPYGECGESMFWTIFGEKSLSAKVPINKVILELWMDFW